MAGAMTALIAGACLSFSGNGHEACSKAIEAGAKQSGFEQNVNKAEEIVTKEANGKAHYLLGDTGMEVVGGGIFIAKTVRDKSIQFNLPTLGICDRISSHVSPDNYGLQFVWRLP